MSESNSPKYVNLADLVSYLEEKGYVVTDTTNNSLTVPLDSKPVDEKKSKQKARKDRQIKLTDEQLDIAVEQLTRKFPQVEKRWSDPAIPGQTICLCSFQPARGAKPDADGLFGYFKVRGVHPDEKDADIRAEYLINEVDSYHPINQGYVGQPLPLTVPTDERYALEVDTISFQKKLKEEMHADVKTSREKEKRDLEEIQARKKRNAEKEEAAIRGEGDPEEKYTTLRVKRSNMIFSLYEMLKTLKRYKDTLLQTVTMIEDMDKKHPEFQVTFIQKYNHAAEEVGIPTEKNFILKYLVGPIPFDLSIVPDTLPLVDMAVPEMSPFNPDSINPHNLAEEMAFKAQKGSHSLVDLDRNERKEGKLVLAEEMPKPQAPTGVPASVDIPPSAPVVTDINSVIPPVIL